MPRGAILRPVMAGDGRRCLAWNITVYVGAFCGSDEESGSAPLPIPCGLNSYRHSIAFPWCGEGLYVGELVVAALVTGADRSHTAVGEPLLVMNKL